MVSEAWESGSAVLELPSELCVALLYAQLLSWGKTYRADQRSNQSNPSLDLMNVLPPCHPFPGKIFPLRSHLLAGANDAMEEYEAQIAKR